MVSGQKEEDYKTHLTKKEAYLLFEDYGYNISYSTFTRTKWKELKDYYSTDGKYKYVPMSACLEIIKRDIAYMKREAAKEHVRYTNQFDV